MRKSGPNNKKPKGEARYRARPFLPAYTHPSPKGAVLRARARGQKARLGAKSRPELASRRERSLTD